MPNGAQQKITLAVPLFSTDYAQVNREISEWNRRARPSFGTIEDVLNQLRIDLQNLSNSTSGIATATSFGTVKTNQTVAAPVVYLKSAVDALVAQLNGQITNLSISIAALTVSINTLIAWQTPQRGSGYPDPTATPGRFDGDTYWDASQAPPGSFRWNGLIAFWESMA